MEFKEYYIESKTGKSNCVVRSLCKILNREYEEVFNELVNIAHELNCESFNDIPVFEKYMNNYHINKINSNEIQIKELNLGKGSYIILCYDQKDYYHMIPIIDNIIYDKSNECLDLYVINIYKKEEIKDIRNREWINNNSKVSKLLSLLIEVEDLLIDLDEYQMDNNQKYPELEDMMLEIGELRRDFTNYVDNNSELLNIK